VAYEERPIYCKWYDLFNYLGLTIDDRHELLNLRKEIKTLREQVEDNEQDEEQLTESESEEETEDNILPEEEILKKKVRLSAPRIAVSAEVYGAYYAKNYKPVVHPKTEDQITAIKSRVIQSFLFNSLDANELKIVIDAMDVRKFKKDDVVIEQGEQGDCLYMVESGELNCFKKFVKIYLTISQTVRVS
jgi:cAMP-dependent protein kinase regulator